MRGKVPAQRALLLCVFELSNSQHHSATRMLPGRVLIVNCLSYCLINSKLISPHLNTSYFLSLTDSSPEVEKTSPGESKNC